MPMQETNSVASDQKEQPAGSALEPKLEPIQLTPQRLQMIGVTMGAVEMKSMADEVRATGTVEVDERRVAYVQTRFPGWVRQVFADASYQYVRRDSLCSPFTAPI